jgi:hypothetical protein
VGQNSKGNCEGRVLAHVQGLRGPEASRRHIKNKEKGEYTCQVCNPSSNVLYLGQEVF